MIEAVQDIAVDRPGTTCVTAGHYETYVDAMDVDTARHAWHAWH